VNADEVRDRESPNREHVKLKYKKGVFHGELLRDLVNEVQ